MEAEIRGYLSDAEFSADGRFVLTVSRDAPVVREVKGSGAASQPANEELPYIPVRIFEANSGKQLTAFKIEKNTPPNPKHPWAGQRNHVHSAHFSPDGRRALVVEDDSFSRYTTDGGNWRIGSHDQPTAVRIFDVATGKELVTFRLQGSIRALFSPDGRQVLTASQLMPDMEVVLKMPATGAPLPFPFGVTVGKSICLWDAATGARLTKLDLVGKTPCSCSAVAVRAR
jgi:WD40 repeat protein